MGNEEVIMTRMSRLSYDRTWCPNRLTTYIVGRVPPAQSGAAVQAITSAGDYY